MKPRHPGCRSTAAASFFACLLAALGACGDGPGEIAAERCKGAVHKLLGSADRLRFAEPVTAGLREDAVYGWHLDLDVEAKLATGETRRGGFRCLFVVENREQPLFLAVVER